jgi:hypothetical protein
MMELSVVGKGHDNGMKSNKIFATVNQKIK